jgi:ketosteroid isomerase-like protein
MKTVCLILVLASAAPAAPQATVADTIVRLERGALDRWGKGDPQGYVELFAPEITYFDPFTEKRVDGIDAMKKMLAPFVGKIHIDSYDLLNAKVQQSGDIAVLTFNLVSHTRNPDGSPKLVRWNSTEVYRRTAGKWRIIHNHWSFIRPGTPNPETFTRETRNTRDTPEQHAIRNE